MVGTKGVRKMLPNSRSIVLPDGKVRQVSEESLRAGRRSTVQDPVQKRKIDKSGRVFAYCECCKKFVQYWPLGTKKPDMSGVLDIVLTPRPGSSDT